MFQPSLGLVSQSIRAAGFEWNPLLNQNHAMALVVMAATWKQISYNFPVLPGGASGHPEIGDRGRGD